MPEANQYTFTHRELVELLVKQAGIHEGNWALLVQFGMTSGNTGPNTNALAPMAMVMIGPIGIQRLPPGMPADNNLTVDAAKVNPPEATG